MTKDKPHVVVALVGERVERDDYIEVGTILMGEYPTEEDADRERARRNALVREDHPSHRGRQYITMSVAEYEDMSSGRIDEPTE